MNYQKIMDALDSIDSIDHNSCIISEKVSEIRNEIIEFENQNDDVLSLSGIILRIALNEASGNVSTRIGIHEAEYKIARLVQKYANLYRTK